MPTLRAPLLFCPLIAKEWGGDLFFTSEHEIESVCVTGRQVCGCRVKEAGGGGGDTAEVTVLKSLSM